MSTEILKNMAQVLVVSDIKRTMQYYKQIGFITEDYFGHVELGPLTFIIRQAIRPEEVRPHSRVAMDETAHAYVHNHYDTYAYLYGGEQVDELYERFKSKGAMFAYTLVTDGEPGSSFQWRRFGLTDPDGYVITFGARL